MVTAGVIDYIQINLLYICIDTWIEANTYIWLDSLHKIQKVDIILPDESILIQT